MSSSSSSTDFYSDLTVNGVEGGNELSPVAKLGWAFLVFAMIVLIFGITMWQLESNGIIAYKDPASDTAKWLAYGCIIAGSIGVVGSFAPSMWKTWQDMKKGPTITKV
jgi:hypothetical protein